MNIIDWISGACILAGAAFFLAGTIALLRFPDVYCRLHALAKVDNLGLGFVILGLLARVDSLALGLKLILVWLLALVASATVGFLIARRARRYRIAIWTPPESRP